MSSFVGIQNPIQKLQKQAAEIKGREFDKTVQEIRAKMQAFGITVKDLRLTPAELRKGKGKSKAAASGAAKAGAGKKKKSAVAVAAKYQGPNGESWTGRGLTPRWLQALLVDGKTKDDFAIKT